MKKLNPFMVLLLLALLGVVPITVQAVEINTFVFLDQFPENSVPLGFPKERVIQVGAFVKAGDTNIKEVTAVNLESGVTLNARLVGEISKIMPTIYLVEPMPAFDPNKHMGIWDIRVTDDKGKVFTAKTHKLDKIEKMPYVENLKASGNPLAPEISWKEPKNIPEGCNVMYIVRLLKDYRTQIYRSGNLKDTVHVIPEGKLKQEDLDNTYVRIECQCFDSGESENPNPLELRSETFITYKEALAK
ncbi:MAG: hypothetical protein WBN03_18875 [Desulfobacterales bacterium]